MASSDSSRQLLDVCRIYHRNIALAHLDTPPGAVRNARLAEAVDQTQFACSLTALQESASLYARVAETERPALERLNAWGLGMHLRGRLRPAWQAAQSRLLGATCYVGEEAIPLRQCFAHMAAERRRDQREAIESAALVELGSVNEVFGAYFEEHRRAAADLDFVSVDGLWSSVSGLDAVAQQEAAAQILEETREVYVDLLTWAVKRRLRVPISQLRRHDVLAMFSFDEYHHYYQPGVLLPAIQASCRHIGLDPDAGGRLIWSERPARFGPPEALGLQIPEEVVLAHSLAGGVKGAELWASALGRAMLWVHADAGLPEIYRLVADPAVAGANALLFADLVAHPDWLRHYLAVWADDDYSLWRRLDSLYRLRRQLGRFLFTRHLYTADSLAGAAETYRDIMMEACWVDYAPEYYLLDVDWHYESVSALWSRSLAFALLKNLRGQFSADWFRNPESGAWLRQYWSTALGESVNDLLQLHLNDSEWTAAQFAEMFVEASL